MQITYFPYLNMRDQTELVFQALGLKVWNYGLKSSDYLPDPKQRAIVDKFMHANLRHKRPITDMGIVSIGEFDMRPFTPEEKQLCREARLLLFLGQIAYSGVLERGPNTGHYMATSENFGLVEQNFDLDGEYTSVHDGYIVQKFIGGYRVDELKFPMADSTPTPIRFHRDARLIGKLLRLRKSQKRLYRRILQATEVLMQSYYNDTKLGSEVRILMMAAAYEILFELPESAQRKALKEVFERMFVLPNDPKLTFVSHNRRDGTPVRLNASIKVYWANQFYQLRSNIIHGSIVKPADYVFRNKQMHYEIATLFFVLGVKKLVGGCPGMTPTFDRIEWGKNGGKDDADDIEYEGFIYENGDLEEMISRDMNRHRK